MTVLKRSIITLYSGADDVYSQQVRIVLAEKAVNVDILNADSGPFCEDLAELNPYRSIPTLVDRELVLYTAPIIMEYLDERFPHPPLLPVYPVARARCRLMMYRIEKDWYSLLTQIGSEDEKVAKSARVELKEGLIGLAPVFSETPYFLSEDFTLVDCYLAPLLWRLPSYGVEIPRGAKAIREYSDRLFNRDSFQVSLSEVERELRETDDF